MPTRDFCWDLIARLILSREPKQAYNVPLYYLKHEKHKPYNVDFMTFKSRIKQVFHYLPLFPVRYRMRGEIPADKEDYKEQKEPLIDKQIMHSQRNGGTSLSDTKTKSLRGMLKIEE